MEKHLPVELEAVRRELDEAGRWAENIARTVSEDEWRRRPRPGAWSPAELITHLILTTEQFLPLIRAALARGRENGAKRQRPYRKDLRGRLLAWALEPPVRWVRARTTPPFVPTGLQTKEETIGRFEDSQRDLMAELQESADLDLNQLKITSPFNARIRYNLFSGFAILAAHQRRHLWQAEQACSRQHHPPVRPKK
jgi:hypothetical protein